MCAVFAVLLLRSILASPPCFLVSSPRISHRKPRMIKKYTALFSSSFSFPILHFPLIRPPGQGIQGDFTLYFLK